MDKGIKTFGFKVIHITMPVVLLVLAGCAGNHTGDGVLLEDFPTRQQTTEYTCGCVSAQMVMQYYHVDYETEEGLAKKMHTYVDNRTPGALRYHRRTDRRPHAGRPCGFLLRLVLHHNPQTLAAATLHRRGTEIKNIYFAE